MTALCRVQVSIIESFFVMNSAMPPPTLDGRTSMYGPSLSVTTAGLGMSCYNGGGGGACMVGKAGKTLQVGCWQRFGVEQGSCMLEMRCMQDARIRIK